MRAKCMFKRCSGLLRGFGFSLCYPPDNNYDFVNHFIYELFLVTGGENSGLEVMLSYYLAIKLSDLYGVYLDSTISLSFKLSDLKV